MNLGIGHGAWGMGHWALGIGVSACAYAPLARFVRQGAPCVTRQRHMVTGDW